MPSKTEKYLALAKRTTNGLTQYWENKLILLHSEQRAILKYLLMEELLKL